MSSEDLRLFMEERLLAMDPNIRIDEGSPASSQVIEPTVRRFQPDAFETDLQTLVITRLRQEFPLLAVDEGSPILDLLIKPALVLLEPFRREIQSIRRNQSLADPDTLNADEADALLANTFTRRNTGDFARGKVRLYFSNPVTVNTGSSNVCYTASGLRFVPTAPQSITNQAMLFNTDGDLYYFDIDYTAEAPGTKYNIASEQIIGVTGIASAVRATNLSAFSSGLSEESTIDMVARGEESIGERSLTTIPGIVARLFSEFPSLQLLSVIGFNDDEMQRDVVRGGSLGDVVMSGPNGTTSDDGDGDGYTPLFEVTSFVAPYTNFTAQFGPAGTSLSGYTLTTFWEEFGVYSTLDFELKQVESATAVSIADAYTYDERIPDNLASATWFIRESGTITLSQIPGGIVFPDSNGVTVDVPNNEIHVGGCSDFYVKGATTEEASVTAQIIADRDAIVRGLIAQTYGVSGPEEDVVSLTLTQAEYDAIVAGTTALRLLAGDVGVYRILNKRSYAAGVGTVVIDTSLSTDGTNLNAELVDDIDISLTDPKEVRTEAADLRVYAGLDTVDNPGTTNYSLLGVSNGDYLVILNGNTAGEYEILSVAANQLQIDTTLAYTENPLNYRIIRKLGDPLELPLLRIRSVELLNSQLKPREEFIPYRHPVDIQSRRFANVGREPKAGTNTVITDDSLTVNKTANAKLLTSSNTAIDYYDLGVRTGDLVNILTSDNTGFFTVATVGGSPDGVAAGINAYELLTTEDLSWDATGMSYEVGGASVGSFRTYFLEPCTFSVDADSLFSVTVADGTTRRFVPDPSIWYEFLPTADTTSRLQMTASQAVASIYETDGTTEVSAFAHNVEVGDRVEITFAPLVGDLDIAALPSGQVTGLDGKSVKLDLGLGEEIVTFSAGGGLTIDQIIAQINAQLSSPIAGKYESGGSDYLKFDSDNEVTVLYNSGSDATASILGTDRTVFQPWIASGPSGDVWTAADQTTDNDGQLKGYWYVTSVNPTATDRNTIELEDIDGNAFSPPNTLLAVLAHYIKISHTGVQRITSTEMESQIDEHGLYYFDVECISEGYGEPWNIEPELSATLTGYNSEGWGVSVDDSNLSYSMAEEPWLHITPRILVTGGTDDPDNYIELTEENIQVNFEQPGLVSSIHSFVLDPQERVVCQSPLVRALFPIFVRTAISYISGGQESDIRSDISTHMEAVLPDNQLEASDLLEIVSKSGATKIDLPITLIGIKHNADRSISVERSEDSISSERLHALRADDDGTTTEGASYIILSRS